MLWPGRSSTVRVHCDFISYQVANFAWFYCLPPPSSTLLSLPSSMLRAPLPLHPRRCQHRWPTACGGRWASRALHVTSLLLHIYLLAAASLSQAAKVVAATPLSVLAPMGHLPHPYAYSPLRATASSPHYVPLYLPPALIPLAAPRSSWVALPHGFNQTAVSKHGDRNMDLVMASPEMVLSSSLSHCMSWKKPRLAYGDRRVEPRGGS
jgi:hypothetical protein